MDIVTLDIIGAVLNSLKYTNIEKYKILKRRVVLVKKLVDLINDESSFTVTIAAMLKDIGDMRNSDINHKSNYASAELIRIMPEIIPLQYEIADIILDSNEKIDGTGFYQKTDISIESQIVAIIDEYISTNKVPEVGYESIVIKGLQQIVEKDYVKIMLDNNDYIDNFFTYTLKKNNVYKIKLDNVEEEQFLSVIASIIDSGHQYTGGHTKRVATYSYVLGKEMGYDKEKLSEIRYAAYLHDIGKLVVDVGILDKPDKLTNYEFEKIKDHALYSYKILQDSPQLKNISYGALHHERLDGKGYPFGLLAKDIPTETRIITFADILDALTSNRPYRKPLTFKKALEIMEKTMVGKSIDPDIFEIAKYLF
ncbi:HD-GYP domain-containing protein (c-di-GMP phosphodiesterase class II) [Hypnocyclicus thermotrophus]|uniref:HD-GYP domain-containing protein (C-di-GMP phosphodiesterase class II) n=1 Tax=Hypnocyclicus thermotrophus TaxID=1627895 RepID=A0AA46DX59_9FUSO|nr:HD domain-containing phosphohydrolase [Hypnocyclicus thermotrophus]TDT67449.1 HD-GYP domain-containing protein (c-di-GMP phosphodiesterase class II) [Hypnocyclicus thermotrophus]